MYGFSTKVLDGTFEEIESKVTEALKEEGFGILTEINVQATLKNKLGLDKPAYKILGACNPKLANQALDAEPEIGLLLPCNVVIREESGGHVVSFMDPAAVMTLVDKEGVAELASVVKEKMERVKQVVESA